MHPEKGVLNMHKSSEGGGGDGGGGGSGGGAPGHSVLQHGLHGALHEGIQRVLHLQQPRVRPQGAHEVLPHMLGVAHQQRECALARCTRRRDRRVGPVRQRLVVPAPHGQLRLSNVRACAGAPRQLFPRCVGGRGAGTLMGVHAMYTVLETIMWQPIGPHATDRTSVHVAQLCHNDPLPGRKFGLSSSPLPAPAQSTHAGATAGFCLTARRAQTFTHWNTRPWVPIRRLCCQPAWKGLSQTRQRMQEADVMTTEME